LTHAGDDCWRRIHDASDQLKIGNGDVGNCVLQGKRNRLCPAAVLTDLESGGALAVITTKPGRKSYTDDVLNGSIIGRHCLPYTQHKTLCLKTAHYPDLPNHPDYRSALLKPGERMRSTTIFTFGKCIVACCDSLAAICFSQAQF
jgi:aldose 1-epimerase